MTVISISVDLFSPLFFVALRPHQLSRALPSVVLCPIFVSHSLLLSDCRADVPSPDIPPTPLLNGDDPLHQPHASASSFLCSLAPPELIVE